VVVGLVDSHKFPGIARVFRAILHTGFGIRRGEKRVFFSGRRVPGLIFEKGRLLDQTGVLFLCQTQLDNKPQLDKEALPMDQGTRFWRHLARVRQTLPSDLVLRLAILVFRVVRLARRFFTTAPHARANASVRAAIATAAA